MAEVLGVISSVLALCQTVDALRKGVKLVASAQGAPEAFIHLHNELTSVSSYLHQVHDTLDDLPPGPSGSSAGLDYVQRVADALVTDVAELLQLASVFEADANGRVDAHGRPKISKFKWTRHRNSIEKLREQISRKRTDLAHALSVLQTNQGTRTTSLVIDLVEVSTKNFGNITTSTQRTETAIGELQTRMGDWTQSRDEREGRLHEEIAGVRKTLQELRNQLRTEDPTEEDLERTFQGLILDTKRNPGTNRHESRQSDNTLLTVHTTLSSRRPCNASCTCQCHRSSRAGTPGLLSSLVGKLLISYNGIPGWKPRTCNHPGCLRKSPNQVQLSYLFPRWMLRKGLSVVLSWDSMTGSGASLHLTVPRVIDDDHDAWRALNENNVAWLQTKTAAREVIPTDVDPQGLSLTMYALRQGSSNEIYSCLLTDYPVSAISWQDRYGRTLAYEIHRLQLTYSKVADFPAICRALDLTEDDRFSTPIIEAVRDIGATSLEVALDMNPGSVNDRDATGRTALHWAALRGDEDAVRVLLSYKADPSATDLSGHTPLHLAAECHNSSSIMQILLAAGSDPNAQSHYGHIPLHSAVLQVAHDNVVALLQAGSKVDASDDNGENAFHKAAWGFERTGYTSNTEEDLLRIFQSLIEYGGDPNKVGPRGNRPLDYAITHNNIAMFRALYRLGVEVDYQDKDGWTILHYASFWARSELLAALLEMEISTIDPDQAHNNGWTPTHLFWYRLDRPLSELSPNRSRPTEEETALFEQLVTEMRERYHGLVYSDPEERESSECSDSEEEEWLDAEETV